MFKLRMRKKIITYFISLCFILSSFVTGRALNVSAAENDIDVTPANPIGTANSGENIVFPSFSYNDLGALVDAGYTIYEVKYIAKDFTSSGTAGCMAYINSGSGWHNNWSNIEANKEVTVRLDLIGKTGQIHDYGIQFNNISGTVSYEIKSAKFIYTGGGSGGDNPDDPDDPDDPVDTDVNYAKLLQESLYLYDANMCGNDVGEKSAFTWRDDCHTYDSNVIINGKTVDVSGGFHDAGDHVKFGLPEGYAATVLGIAYMEFKDAFTKTKSDEHLRVILNHFCEYFERCTVLKDDGTVDFFVYQVGQGNVDHGYWGKPEEQPQDRRGGVSYTSSNNPATDEVSEAIAALTLEYLNFGDETALSYAEKLFEFEMSFSNKACAKDGDGPSNFYSSDSYADDYCLAAALLYKATKKQKYINEFNSYKSSYNIYSWLDWNGVACFADYYGTGNADALNKCANNMKKSETGYSFLAQWGSARYNCNAQFAGLLYDKASKTNNYGKWATGQMSYLLGNNTINTKGQCFVVGYNDLSPKYPHHKAASNSYDASVHSNNHHILLGALVGGPTDANGTYSDSQGDWTANEVTLDYNAGLVGAAAALYLLHENDEEVPKSLMTEDDIKNIELREDKKYGISEVPPVHTHDLKHTSAKEATCAEEGNIEYWYCKDCKKYFSDKDGKNEITDTDSMVIPKTDHDWGNFVYTWSDDNREATAHATCLNGCGEEYTEVVNSSYTVVLAPKCETVGIGRYAATFGDKVHFTGQKKEVEIPALGHKWGVPTYTWSEDKSKVTAEVSCLTCKKTKSETVDTVYEEVTPASCLINGQAKYTAIFKDEIFSAQSKEVELPATGHAWGEWEEVTPATESDDGLERRICSNDPTHIEERPIPSFNHVHDFVYNDKNDAQCEKAGNIAYYICKECGKMYASINETEGINELNKEDILIKPTGHKWIDPTYKWSEDNSTVTAKAICENNHIHGLTEKVYTKVTESAPDCTTNGKKIYTASFENDVFKVQTKEVDIPATEHKWGNPTYEWSEDNSRVRASVTCENGCGTMETETSKSSIISETQAGCETEGKIKYSAVFTNNKFVGQKKEIVVPATGHKWGDWIIEKSPTSTENGIEKRICSNCKKVETRDIPKSDDPDGKSDISDKGTFDKDKSDNNNKEDSSSNNNPSSNPGDDVNDSSKSQKAVDGTDVGPGASPAVAEKAIISSKSDEGPVGSKYNLLQAKQKKVTKKSITISWKKIKGAKYIIYGNECGKGMNYKKLATVKKNSFTHKKLKKGKYYKFIVVAVKKGKVVSTSKTLHISTRGGKTGNVKKLTLNKKSISLKRKKTFKLRTKLTVESKKLKVKKHRKIKYESANPKVATVSNSGKIKAVKKGTTYIYAYAQNGAMARIKVKVK